MAMTLAARAASGAPSTGDHVAWVVVAGDDADSEAISQALAAPLAELGLELRASRDQDLAPPSAGDRRPRVAIDARSPEDIVILVWAGSNREAEPVRRSIRRDAARAIVADETAYAVRATLESLLTPPPPAPPPAAAPVIVTTEPDKSRPAVPRFGVDATAFGDARGIADSTPGVGGGIALDFVLRGSSDWRPDVWIAAGLDAPFSRTTTEVTLDTTVYSVRAIPTLEVARVGPLRIGAGVGGGLDILYAATAAGSGAARVYLRPSSTYADPIVEAAVFLRARLTRRVGAMVAVAIEGDAAPHRFSEVGSSGRASDVTLWAARPVLTVGLCFALTGASACAGEP
jgi:hypothetical protein